MTIYFNNLSRLFYRIFFSFIAFTFVFSQIIPPDISYAQVATQSVLHLPIPGSRISLSTVYSPTVIKGITIFPDNPLQFDFIVNIGDDNLGGEAFKNEATKLIKYFMASLTIPEDEMWVNLSPYEKDRIIPKGFRDTEMGRDLLAQDYILKQLTASLLYPEEELGNNFWNRVYAKAQKRYGTSEIPMNTFNKVWIVPEKATVYVNGYSVFIIDNYLKVMLEEDYLVLEANKGSGKHGLGNVKEDDLQKISSTSSEVLKEIILPEIEKEVNEGKNFATLRQIYNSVILAKWYKENLKKSFLGQAFVDKKATKGVDVEDKKIIQKIYNQYVEAFKKGTFDYIKKDYDTVTQEIIPRKYFSGGAFLNPEVDRASLSAQSAGESLGDQRRLRRVKVRNNLIPKEQPSGSSVGVLQSIYRLRRATKDNIAQNLRRSPQTIERGLSVLNKLGLLVRPDGNGVDAPYVLTQQARNSIFSIGSILKTLSSEEIQRGQQLLKDVLSRTEEFFGGLADPGNQQELPFDESWKGYQYRESAIFKATNSTLFEVFRADSDLHKKGERKIEQRVKNGELYYYVETNMGIFRFKVVRGIVDDQQVEIVQDNNGNLWKYTKDGVNALIIVNDRLLPEPTLLSDDYLETYTNLEIPKNGKDVIDGVIENNEFPPEWAEGIINYLRQLQKATTEGGEIQPLPTNATGQDSEEWNENARYWNTVLMKDYIGKNWNDDIPQMLGTSFFYRHLIEAVRYREIGVDPFGYKKEPELTSAMKTLPEELQKVADSEDPLRSLYLKSLWGNSFDPSNKIIAGGQRIIHDHVDKLMELLKNSKGEIWEYDTDNAASEVIWDLLFIDPLLENNLIKKVNMNVKPYPYLISDVIVDDVTHTIDRLISHADPNVQAAGRRLFKFRKEGRLNVQGNHFLVSGLGYSSRPKKSMTKRKRILKGDVLWRQITNNRYYGIDSDMADVIAGNKETFIVSRVVKDEIVVGSDRREIIELEKIDPEWYKHGKGAMVQITKPRQDNSPSSPNERFVDNFKERPRPVMLRGFEINDVWGGDLISEVTGYRNPESRPIGRMWFGSHPQGSADVIVDKKNSLPLSDLIAASPAQVLGSNVSESNRGKQTKQLVLLHAAKILSLQLHHNKKQATAGFAEEEEKGVPIDAEDRIFKDSNAKPEFHVALTDFWLLNGFRALETIENILKTNTALREMTETTSFKSNVGNFSERLQSAAKNAEARQDLLKDLYTFIMKTLNQENVNKIVTSLLDQLPQNEDELDKDSHNFWVVRAAKQFPVQKGNWDRNIIVFNLLNLIHLKPGQGTYQAPGALHTYLEGLTMEVMSTSDNTVRAGLTEKVVDVDRVIDLLNYEDGDTKIYAGEEVNTVERVYKLPEEVIEFELSQIRLKANQVYSNDGQHGDDILVVVEGEAILKANDGSFEATFKKGENIASLVPAGITYEIMAITETSLYRATTADAAMFSNPTGGIDFNPNMFELEAFGNNFQFDFNSNPQEIMNIEIEGIVPTIINITPITNLPFLIGVLENKTGKQLGKL